MKVSSTCSVVFDFLKKTTLHGFKYLGSRYLFDRLFWLVVCCASACSAGVLCAVLWARFVNQPAVVALKDHKDLSDATKGMPLVLLCPPAHEIAARIVTRFKGSNETWLASTLEYVIRKRAVEEDHLMILDNHLDHLGLALPDALMKYSPECQDMIISCRWQSQLLPCRRLISKQFTDWGLCCVLDPVRLQKRNRRRLFDHLETTRRLEIALTCSNANVSHYGCEVNDAMLLPVYKGDADIVPQMLHQGTGYWLKMTFTMTLANDGSLLNINDACESDERYSKLLCIAKCMEDICGCSDPLKTVVSDHDEQLPRCRTSELNCLRSTKAFEKSSCVCLPSCTKFTTDFSIETNNLDFIKYTFDPLYHDLNSSLSNVVYIEVRLRESKEFFVLPTKSWLTLLSSLGGVFNMFLGVGLFSALEFLFLVIKLPLALRRSVEMPVPEA